MTDTIVNNYRILTKIGEGGMGAVYLAEHVRLKRKAALKFLSREILNDKESLVRFEREALAISAINHPNIVTIYDIDAFEDVPYIAMEYVDGFSLKSLFGSQSNLPVDIAIHLQYQIAQGLLRTHQASIVHRDIKPANIMVSREGYIKILDFGLAKLMDASRITRSEHTLGTVHYIAPEMYLGNSTDHRADIWGIGVLFYQMLTGALPFEGSNMHKVMFSVVNKSPVPLQGKNPDLPTELQGIIDKCLAKDREYRYKSLIEMVEDLVALSMQLMTSPGVSLETQVAKFVKSIEAE
ncbi:MAG: serine/threonine protein kinase [Rhodothermaceae bacterium]|nr:serine/threonine protein kinase [Rhodothermaceae bacterium]